ncbi:MAG TPA: DNA recombination protein RmuC [Methylomirabilota bacterium]|nr:DNA recombination protein RmuC [Methylomirabilota bacterium]
MSEPGWALAAVAVLAIGVAVWALSRRGPGHEPAVDMLQRQIEAVRAEGREGQAALQKDLGALQLTVAQELKSVSLEVSRQLQEGMKLIQSGQQTMGERLDRAAQVVGEVQGGLGRLGEATKRVIEVGQGLQGLEQILKSPKMRGGLGEMLLEQLLGEFLAQDSYALQHPFKSGEKVDAVIRIGGRLVPVDAKFPLENFRRVLAETEEGPRRAFRREFARDVKRRVDEIAKKYVLPDEGTFDFALMYVPAENVYYEMIVKDDDAEEESMAGYALERRVIPVSPNSFYAYLQVIVLGLRGLRIEANAREIQNDLTRLGGDLEKVKDHFGKLGGHLKNAQAQYADAERDLMRFEAKLEAIERKGDTAALPGPAA